TSAAAEKAFAVAVEATQAVKADSSNPPTMPSSSLAVVKRTPGVKEAEGSVSYDTGTLLDSHGKAIKSNAPTLIGSISTVKRFESLDYDSGSQPKTADQVVIDRGTSKKYGFKVGSRITVQGDAPAKTYTVSGVGSLGGRDSLGGARYIGMILPEAQRVSGHDGYDSISVAASDPDKVKAALQRELGRNYNVRTGKEAAHDQ